MSNEKVLGRVRKMLDQANHPNTSAEEREMFLSKVDDLMVKHAIDEALLAATQSPSERRTPVTETVEIFDRGSVHSHRFRTIFGEVCRTVRVRYAFGGSRERQQLVTLVGYRDDVEYAQLLFTTIQFGFIAKIRPTWNPDQPLGANLYAFKAAGYDWHTIYTTAAKNGVECDEARETLWSPYDTYVRKNGLEKIKTNRFGAYRDSFAEAFVARICSRLEEMRNAGAKQAASSGAELVLVRSMEDVDEEFYRMYPDERPLTDEELQRQRRAAMEALRLQREKHEAWLNAMTPAQRAAHEKQVQEQARKDARDNERYWREFDKNNARRYDSAGRRAGAAAADSVNLARSGPAAGASDRKELS